MATKPIIVGVDGSPESLRAAAQAAAIASAAHAQLVAVHAVPVIPAFTGVAGIEPMPGFSPELQLEVSRASRAHIERALEKIAPKHELEVQVGPAAVVIAEVARRRRAELVVLGGKRHGPLARGLGRSTAHYLVRTLEMPVLIVGESAAPITHVLAAVDLSPVSLPTAKAAQRIAHLLGARLRLLHVVERLRFADLAPDLWNEQEYRQRSEEMFRRFAAPVEDVATEDRVVRHGMPEEQIVQEAGAWHADLVVVGSHGKGWVDRVLVGSTTQQLVTDLPASLLVVPAGRTPVVSLDLARARARKPAARRGLRPAPKRSRAPRGK
ncbi:MAG TPA: universal stress protein [Gemmatimonadales bacterium]|nr:universal stress protein [Gemmatimonadales bacterium]